MSYYVRLLSDWPRLRAAGPDASGQHPSTFLICRAEAITLDACAAVSLPAGFFDRLVNHLLGASTRRLPLRQVVLNPRDLGRQTAPRPDPGHKQGQVIELSYSATNRHRERGGGLPDVIDTCRPW